jgi:hypothetical protein
MKKMILCLALIFSHGVFAQQAELLLNSPSVNYGPLAQGTNSPANELIVVRRTANTPKKVNLTFTVNHMVPKCTTYDVRRVELQNFSQFVCEPILNGSHDCVQKEYTGFYNAQTVCVQQGLVRTTSFKSVTLDFGRAVRLTPNATETFQVNIKQTSMAANHSVFLGRALNSASVYRATTWWGTTIKFVAK